MLREQNFFAMPLLNYIEGFDVYLTCNIRASDEQKILIFASLVAIIFVFAAPIPLQTKVFGSHNLLSKTITNELKY